MKTKKPRKLQATSNPKARKRRRGRPRKANNSSIQKIAPVKLLIQEIKKDVKRIKKSRKKMELLWDKSKNEQFSLMKDLEKSVKKLKKGTKKTVRRGRKPGRKRGRKPNTTVLIRKKSPGRKPKQVIASKTKMKKGVERKIVSKKFISQEIRAKKPISKSATEPITSVVTQPPEKEVPETESKT
jgi:hypothetical protein